MAFSQKSSEILPKFVEIVLDAYLVGGDVGGHAKGGEGGLVGVDVSVRVGDQLPQAIVAHPRRTSVWVSRTAETDQMRKGKGSAIEMPLCLK